MCNDPVKIFINQIYNFFGNDLLAWLGDNWKIPLDVAENIVRLKNKIPSDILEKENYVNGVLHNDEYSSDEELLDLFVEHGLTQAEATTALKHRPKCLLDMFYWAKIQERTDDFVTYIQGKQAARN